MKRDNIHDTNRRKEEADQLRATICTLLNWQEDEYNVYQYETGLDYLKWYLPNDSEGADMLSRSKIFWNWFRNHWSNRDNGFIRSSLDWPATSEDLELLYKELNDARTLACAIYPNGIIMQESARAIILDMFNRKPLAV
jgi:hypothetical protein